MSLSQLGQLVVPLNQLDQHLLHLSQFDQGPVTLHLGAASGSFESV